MASRAGDWLAQARRDLEHAQHALEDGDYEWACFAAHQAAEKALKAVYQRAGGEAWGHSLRELVEGLKERLRIPSELEEAAITLDRHYIPSRYPDAFPSGAPFQYYRLEDAKKAVEASRDVLAFCESAFSGP
ncbi:MAG: HEPN domain-containing protein [Armatimonadota bacterium]|nr:HEPN domain-containing protein [Armatimonadota bacterium]MDR5704054.1 HEPN domain-containing protein [Armatimonadota bacterium]